MKTKKPISGRDSGSQGKMLNTREAAEMMGMRPQTLAAWRCEKRLQLPYVKVGRTVRYRLADIENFLDIGTVSPVEPN
jgi:predicted site-specific integrase-resolvase